MIFKTGTEFIDAFNGLPKDIEIKEIRHNGSVIQYLANTVLTSIDIQYSENNLKIIYVGLNQEGVIKKIKYFPDQSFMIRFANEATLKDTDS